MAKSGVFAELVPLLLSITIAPLAPILSSNRAFSEISINLNRRSENYLSKSKQILHCVHKVFRERLLGWNSKHSLKLIPLQFVSNTQASAKPLVPITCCSQVEIAAANFSGTQ